jgi:sugar/nucleoside kinase (ribokinase family)
VVTPPRTIGVTGVAVDDTIEMPDGTVTVDRGGIYHVVHTLSALVPPGTTIVPILAVGSDAIADVRRDFGALPGVIVDGLVPVPEVNNKVHIRYDADGSRTESLTGGVSPLGWSTLEPWVGRLEAWLWNMVSGMEVTRETFLRVKTGFGGPIHLDVHSLCLEHHHGGPRRHRPPEAWEAWVAGTTWVQMNEIEARLLWDGRAEAIDPEDEPDLARRVHALGSEGVLITRGESGAAYHGADGLILRLGADAPAPPVDPTGCGDVFGAAWFALRVTRALDPRPAFAGAMLAAGVKATVRGTRGLAERLREAGIVEEPTAEATDGR